MTPATVTPTPERVPTPTALSSPTPTPAPPCEPTSNVIVEVYDSGGNPIVGADVKIAAFKRKSGQIKIDDRTLTINYPDEFPYVPLPDNSVISSLQTDADGTVVFLKEEIRGQPEDFGYFVIAGKQGYLRQFDPAVSCQELGLSGDGIPRPINFTLQSLQEYSLAPSDGVKANYLPVKIQMGDYTYWSRLETANRPIVFPFVPQVRQDILAEATSVDVTLNVVPKDNWPSSKYLSSDDVDWCDPNDVGHCHQIGDFHYQETLTGVAVHQLNKFEFSLPAGLYDTYFRFDIHRAGLSTIQYDYYTRYGSWFGAVYYMFNELEAEDRPASVVQTKDQMFDAYAGSMMILPQDDYKQHNKFEALYPDEVNSSEDRINIIFLSSNLESVSLKDLAKEILEDPSLGLDQVEPLKSNREMFNFWYYPESLTPDEMSFPLDFYYHVQAGYQDLTKLQEIYLSHGFKGKTIIYGLLGDDTLVSLTSAISGKCTFKKGTLIAIKRPVFMDCLQEGSLGGCVDSFDLSRIFFHELGHELGMLGEEYVSSDSDADLFNINAYLSGTDTIPTTNPGYGNSLNVGMPYNPHFRQNTFFPENYHPGVGCVQAMHSAGFTSKAIFCHANQPHFPELLPWFDYYGNGCGEDGIIDCEFNDPQKHMEVGFFLGGGPSGKLGHENLVKPSAVSVMSTRGDFHGIPVEDWNGRIYGLVNEGILCQAIEVYTGQAGGICDSHPSSNNTP
jgi:hypothetical protein